MRAWQFAIQLSSFGHKVVVCCAALPRSPMHSAAEDAREGGPRIWPVPVADVAPVRSGITRRVRTLLRIAFGGGPEAEWTSAAVDMVTRRSRDFLPDVVIGVFGNLGAAYAARRIAQRLRRPWLLDVKDGFIFYIPCGLRTITRIRLSSASSLICNSHVQNDLLRRWLWRDAHVVYSGVDPVFWDNGPESSTDNIIQIVGGIYSQQSLDILLKGITAWAEELGDLDLRSFRVRYLGSNGPQVLNRARALSLPLAIEDAGYVAPARMAEHCRRALLNTYVWLPDAFHHKLLELLSTGRPILAVPGESEESRRLSANVGGELHTAATPLEVKNVITSVRGSSARRDVNAESIRPYSWNSQARSLESILVQVLKGARGVNA